MNKHKIKLFFSILLIALLPLIFGACASSGRGKGKIKRGKPIPCPVKDC
ncbi:MAG: hypothetical protein MUE81_14090 [Thermoflexibacter sp.]|jgi:hypothetical protein|nr:hypothetical protein [Thermoflexibacter sp.]